MARIQDGDDDALVALIKKYERLLKTIVHYEIHNVEEEADIYSETVLAIVRRIRRQADDIASPDASFSVCHLRPKSQSERSIQGFIVVYICITGSLFFVTTFRCQWCSVGRLTK